MSGAIKENLNVDRLNMPSQFKRVLKQIRNLEFYEDPNYESYIKSFVDILVDRGFSLEEMHLAFDWNQSHKRRPQ